LVDACDVGGGFKVQDEAADNSEDDGCQFGVSGAVHAVLKGGEPVGSGFASEAEPQLLLGVRPDALVETFLQDCPADIGKDAAHHLAQQSLAVTQQPVRAAAWQQVPSTYLVCTEDNGTIVASQREFARRATAVVAIGAGHHPFLSQPEVVADLILGLS